MHGTRDVRCYPPMLSHTANHMISYSESTSCGNDRRRSMLRMIRKSAITVWLEMSILGRHGGL